VTERRCEAPAVAVVAKMDEIKALQEEFARAQMSGSMAKLSERNCVEVIMMLQKFDMIDLLYTMDGKQYVTPAQLETDIRNEISYRGGRVNLVEMHELVNVDLSVVEATVTSMLKTDGYLTLVQGDLVDRTYIEGLAVEVNDMLQEAGYVSIAELCSTFDLPFDFLLEKLEPLVGTVVKGQLDVPFNTAYFTEAFVRRQRARVLGVFSGITRPTALSALRKTFPFHERLFQSELDKLIADGKLAGKVQGRMDRAEFVPHIQQRTQDKWIQSFFRENGYVEYDTVERLGIRKPQSRLKSMFPNGCTLETCIVGSVIVDNVNESIDLAIKDGQFVDVMTLLPSSCTLGDADILISQSPPYKKAHSASVLCDSIVCSAAFVSQCTDIFKDMMVTKAKKAATATASQTADAHANAAEAAPAPTLHLDAPVSKRDKRKEKRKKKGGKGDVDEETRGGGRGGKNSGGQQATASSRQEWEFMCMGDIEAVLVDKVKECPDHMYSELAALLHRQLHKRFQEYVREAFRGGVSAADRREQIENLRQEYITTYVHTRLCQNGLEHFESSAAASLVRYLLKDLGTKLLNILVRVQAEESYVQCPTGDMTQAERKTVVAQIPAAKGNGLAKLEPLLNAKVADGFLDPLEDAADALGFRVKRSDKKRDKKMVFEHRTRLQEQLADVTEPSAILLLVTVLLFQAHTGCILHAQGRSVSTIITFLKEKEALPQDQLAVVLEYQRKVMLALTAKDEVADSDRVSEAETLAVKALVAKPPARDAAAAAPAV